MLKDLENLREFACWLLVIFCSTYMHCVNQKKDSLAEIRPNDLKLGQIKDGTLVMKSFQKLSYNNVSK